MAITRQQSKLDITVAVEGLEEFNAALREIFKPFGGVTRNSDAKRQIAAAAAPIVIQAVKSRVPNSTKVHYRYGRKGEGKVATYYPENLERSIVDIADVRKRIKTFKSIIGPLYAGRGSWKNRQGRGVFKGKRVDGFYAHMVYGSARAFQNRIMIPALVSVSRPVLVAMSAEAIKIIQKRNRFGL